MSTVANYASVLFDELTMPSLPPAQRWARVEKLVTDGEEESLHLDFKEVTVPGDPAKDDYIKEKLARALPGFANVSGGLLIYGISTKGGSKGAPDRAQGITRIVDVAKFRAALEKLASLVVEPVVAGVDIREVEDPAHAGEGVVAVYVPESVGGPHRAVRTTADTNERYFMRTTTEIQTMPHALLADRFARVARPSLRLVVALSGRALNIKVRNVGRGVAVQPLIRFKGIDNSFEWLRQTGPSPGWAIQWPRGAPTPNSVVYASDPSVVVFPTVDVVAVDVPSRGSIQSAHIEGEIFCRDAMSVAFSGDVLAGKEVELPS